MKAPYSPGSQPEKMAEGCDQRIETTDAEIKSAIKKLKSKDSVGLTGDVLATVGSAVAGASAAGAVSSIAGASTLLGSTALASALGGVIVTTTPVGWVIGGAAVAGTIGYGIAKMIRSGERHDGIRSQIAAKLKHRLDLVGNRKNDGAELKELRVKLDSAVERGLLAKDRADHMLSLARKKTIPADLALERVSAILAAVPVVRP